VEELLGRGTAWNFETREKEKASIAGREKRRKEKWNLFVRAETSLKK